MRHIVFLDEENNPLAVEQGDDYVLVIWSHGEKDENTNVRVLQSEKGNMRHVELAARLLARAMKASSSPLYAMIGHVVETALDKTIENIQKGEQVG